VYSVAGTHVMEGSGKMIVAAVDQQEAEIKKRKKGDISSSFPSA
jgi:hypothetical protein